MRKLLYVMGKSASGKDSIYKKLLENIEQLKGVILYTTRPIRNGERSGVEYYFVSEEELAKKKIIEKRCYDTCYGKWYYATVDDGQFDEDIDMIAIGTLESYEDICSYFGKNKLIPIYIEVDDRDLLLRAIKREAKSTTPKYDEVCRRFLSDKEDFSEDKLIKNKINKKYKNQDIDECIKEILYHIDLERGRK